MSPDVEEFLRAAELARVEFAIPCGGPETAGHNHNAILVLARQELVEYLGDPTGFLARHHGGTREQYIAWCQAGGSIQCSGRTRAGRQCRNASALYLGLREWLDPPRDLLFCAVHR